MKKILFAAVLLLSAVGCVEEGDYITVMVPSAGDEDRSSQLSLTFDGVFEAGTRSILGDSVDSKVSGGAVAVYDADTGLIDSVWEVSDFSTPLAMRLPKYKNADIYVVGNLWYIDSAGARQRPQFPKKESEVASMLYMIGGCTVSAGRTETFSEVAKYGIPVAGVVKAADLSSDTSVKVALKRLFAKVVLTIDHSGLDGTADTGYFENVNVYLRQANARLTPFSSGARTLAQGDVIGQSDYDPSMSNGRRQTYTFYVPENRQGTFPTYVEFNGKVNPSAGGYGGSVCYRFYIGSGEDGDYDVERNQVYNITLGFKVDSLFEPQWKVSRGDDWTDTRILCLAQDQAGSRKLSSSSVIAVRKGRPATCWLYYSRTGSGTNEASVLSPCNGSFSSPDLSAAAWWCEAPSLAENGISLTASGGKLVFSVTDPSKFVIGRRIPLKIHLYPGDIVEEAALTTYDDISVSVEGGLSLTDEFYVGMKRQLKIRGMAGSKIYYWSTYPIDKLALKTEPSEDADYIHNARSSAQTLPANADLNLYAYSLTNGASFNLCVQSDDTFNDGDNFYLGQVIVRVPLSSTTIDRVYLPFDGSGAEMPFDFLDEDGEIISRDRFDEDVYEQRLSPGIIWPSDVDPTFLEWVGSDGLTAYLQSYYADGKFIGDKTTPLGGLLCAVRLGPADKNLQDGLAYVSVYVRAPSWLAQFNDVYTEYFNTEGPSDITASAIARIYDGVPFSTECPSGSFQDVTVTPGSVANDLCTVGWKFSDTGRTADGLAPLGPQTVSLVFKNKRSEETYRLSSTFDVYHVLTLRPFVLFTVNSPTAEILATTAKNAWILTNYCQRKTGFRKVTDFLGLSGATFPQYVTMKYNKATGKSKTSPEIYQGSCSMRLKYKFQDFSPSFYGKNYAWTADRINAFAANGVSPLTFLGFCGPSPSYTTIATPLAASYLGGSPYINMSIKNSYLGCATLP